jgi:hypothetical protein
MAPESTVSSSASEPEPSPERVAAAIERVRAGVMQRRAESATLGELGGGAQGLLLELRAAEHLREPQPVSPRPLVGSLMVFIRKAFFHLFLKWWSRPVLEQQNRFNRASAELLRELIEAAERRERRLRDVESRLQALERRGGQPPSA